MPKCRHFIKSFEVAYHTPSSIPAPYQYNYSIRGTVLAEHIYIEYRISYTGREFLTAEEIYDEGFSEDDNFTWQGLLNKVWIEEMTTLYASTVSGQTPSPWHKDNLHVYIEESAGTIFSGLPNQPELWEHMMQEMIQGIYEVSMRELPLIINFKKVYQAGEAVRITLQPYFNTRKVLMTSQNSLQATRRSVLPWHYFTNILRALYQPEYLPEDALADEPDETGTYIDNGEGLWYGFGKSVQNPKDSGDALLHLEALFLGLKSIT